MDFGAKLKEIRKNEGLSQEQLADKIGVSRQAITKWETGRALPDMENMIILAEIFKTTLDELVSQAIPEYQGKKEVYSSETIYDIDCSKHFDIHFGSANTIVICGGKDEKLHVKLESETMENINQVMKVKLDEHKNKLDVDCVKQKGLSKYEIGEAVSVVITLPQGYTEHCELAADAKKVYMTGLDLKCLEYDGGAEQVFITECKGSLEFTSKSDYDITIDEIHGRLEVNQWRATCMVHLKEGTDCKLKNTGRRCRIYCQKNGERCDSVFPELSENELCIAGINSEMIVDIV